MSKNALSADNPQEMLNATKFWFSGFMSAEMSCSIIKATNKNPKGFYYTIDLTVTNADRKLLSEINREVMKDRGVITPVKGAYNLSARGKDKVQIVLDFLEQYPILAGDLAKNRIVLLKTSLLYLSDHKTSKFQKEKTAEMDKLRVKLKELKFNGVVDQKFDLLSTVDKDFLGYFLAGVIDGEGSFGFKSSGLYKQRFFAIAMKDRKIIELLQRFIGYGNVRLRKDGVYHLEINDRNVLKNVCEMFLNQYPLRQTRQRKRCLFIFNSSSTTTRQSL
jgi:LAGLIDADG DNA endonuclease family protein